MEKHMVIFIIIILFFCASVYAGDDQKGDADFLKELIIKIGQIVPKKILAVSTSRSIRGAGADADTVYWKGEEKKIVVTEEELDFFKAAVNEAVKGNRDYALKMLEQFRVSYPASTLNIDKKKVIEKLTERAHQ